jgi:N-acetylmuramoyl-L-alanine amidase
MKRVGCHAGHGKMGLGRAIGAVSILNESLENRLINAEVIRLLKENGVITYDNTVDTGTKTEILNKIIQKCNAVVNELELSIHFNAGRNDLKGDNSIAGVECFVYNTHLPLRKSPIESIKKSLHSDLKTEA